PMDWAYAKINANNWMLLSIALTTIIIVSLSLYFLFNSLVAKRLKLLADAMDNYPEKPFVNNGSAIENGDEIGVLRQHFHDLCRRFETSQQELDATREQVFQSEKQAALGRLVAGISHEINNPLGGMQNCLQTMRRNLDQPELQNRYMTLLGQGIERIKGTVQQLLNIGRKEPLRASLGDVDQAIRDCLELSCIGHKNIELDMQLGIGQPVTTGIEALRQVVMNLAGNAVQAIGADTGAIRVISRLENGSIFIEITDTGSGIDPEHLDHIFEPFFTTKEVGEGTGLGLSISDSLIKRLGGSLSGRNNTDRGACFTLIIPLQHSVTIEEVI
ncbi:MAG: HAMP domain-containing histidine kinase, partial [Desulfuromusa sp.]|nr:HAMP domain-containing histidine kinase [Desulfuromusa sp.]